MNFELNKDCSSCGNVKSLPDLLINSWSKNNECEKCWRNQMQLCKCGKSIDNMIDIYKSVVLYTGCMYKNCIDCFKKEIFKKCICGEDVTGYDILTYGKDRCSKCIILSCEECDGLIIKQDLLKIRSLGFGYNICKSCFLKKPTSRKCCVCSNKLKGIEAYICKSHRKSYCKGCFSALSIRKCEYSGCENITIGLDVILKYCSRFNKLYCQKHFCDSIIRTCTCGDDIFGKKVLLTYMLGGRLTCSQCGAR